MIKCNKKIRDYAKSNGIYLWQIADSLKVSPETINRKLRHELSESEQKEMIKIIDKLAKTKGE